MRKWIGQISVAAGLAVAIMGWSALGNAVSTPPLEGDMAGWDILDARETAPDFAVTTPDGTGLTRDSFKGRLVLVNFWATWCPPCLEEMPSFDRLQAAYDGAPFEVVAISVDRGGYKQVAPTFQQLGIENLSVYLDPAGGTPYLFGAKGFPASVLISPEGKVLGHFTGPAEWDSPEAFDLIDHYLAESTS